MKSWTERIRQHALTHYTEDGWDILVECWTDEDIAEYFDGCVAYENAVMRISNVLYMLDGYRREIQAEVF
jgi:hypothetical protein